MSAHTCSASSPLLRAVQPAAQDPAIAPPGLFRKLCAAVRLWRSEARIRNMAADMDPHILQDVGAPEWLVNETTLQRDLNRMRNADYMRW